MAAKGGVVSDLREQLRKAGLVSDKQVRQAKHQERLHRKEVGQDGLAAERAGIEKQRAEERERARIRDREIEQERKARQAEEERAEALSRRIRAGWLRDASGGSRRFFFVAGEGRITYLDLNDQAVRRLQNGGAAVVETAGAVRGEFCLVDGATAASLERDHPEVIRCWIRGRG